jgi:hypothetical protein
MSKTVFTEEQRFSQSWLWIIMIASLIGMSLAFAQEFNTSANYLLTMAFGYGITLLVMLFIWQMKLETRIDEEGIHYRFSPLIRKQKSFPWNKIERAEVIQYAPLRDYGGWGYRLSLGSKGRAVNVKGNMGLKLHFKEGKPILIGTQEPEAVKAVIKQFRAVKAD